jgi:thioredoxin-related protein
MKFSKAVLLFVSLFVAVHIASADAWTTDYKEALDKAQKENKLVLIDFTGSDWCGWCIKLDKEVFDKGEFKNYAKQNLILLKIDFPKSKPQSASLKKQNQDLSAQYKIEGYPTIIVLDSKGQQVGQLGYMEGGPKAFIAELDKLKK